MSSGWLSLPTAALLYLTVLSFQFLVFRKMPTNIASIRTKNRKLKT